MKFLVYYFLTLTIILLSTFNSISQDDKVRVRVFDGSEPEEEVKKKEIILKDKNLISFNPYLIARGAFVMTYERAIQPKISILGSLGFTYRDYIFEVFNEDSPINQENGVSASIGYYLDLAMKWYPKGNNNFDGLYLSPGLIRREYNLTEKESSNYNSAGNISSPSKLGYNMTEGYLKFGYVYESWLFNDLIADVYFGFGYKNTQINTVYEATSSSGTPKYLPLLKEKNSPAIYAGFKIGIPF